MLLSELNIGQKALIVEVNITEASLSSRLAELGVRRGETITCLHESPFGGVRSYKLSQGVFALESTIADNISIEKRDYP